MADNKAGAEPDVVMLQTLETQLTTVWSDAHKNFVEDDAFQNETFTIWPE